MSLIRATSIASVFLFIVFAMQVNAQNEGSRLSIDFTPKTPSQNSEVQLTAVGYGLGLDESLIQWFVNGRLANEGIGLKKHTLGPGTVDQNGVEVEIFAETSIGPMSAFAYISAGTVDLVWEAETYTHPLFKGKPLFVPGANIKVVAFPEITDPLGNDLNLNDLFFLWEVDGKKYQEGWGVNDININGAPYKTSRRVEVSINDGSGQMRAQESVTIDSEDPSIVLYPKDPLQGILFSQGIGHQGSLNITQREVGLEAVPYYFSENADSLSYRWQIDGNSVEDNENSLNVRLPESGSGRSTARVYAELPESLLQDAEAVYTLIYKNE